MSPSTSIAAHVFVFFFLPVTVPDGAGSHYSSHGFSDELSVPTHCLCLIRSPIDALSCRNRYLVLSLHLNGNRASTLNEEVLLNAFSRKKISREKKIFPTKILYRENIIGVDECCLYGRYCCFATGFR